MKVTRGRGAGKHTYNQLTIVSTCVWKCKWKREACLVWWELLLLHLFKNVTSKYLCKCLHICLLHSFLHSALLQDDAGEANHPPGHGVCCEYDCSNYCIGVIRDFGCDVDHFQLNVFFSFLFRTVNISTPWSGFWSTTQQTWTWGSLLMKSCLDRSAERPCFLSQHLICDAALCLSDWCFISYTTTCSDSPAWPETRWLRDCRHQWKQGWIHPVRKMLLLCFVFLSVCVNAVWCWHAVLWLTAWWFSGGLWTEYRSRWLPSRR